MSHRRNEHSVRRSINNALAKSNSLKNRNSATKNNSLKRFVPNIAKCLSEHNNLNEKNELHERKISTEEKESNRRKEYDNNVIVGGTNSNIRGHTLDNNLQNNEILKREIPLTASEEPKLDEQTLTLKKYNDKQLVDRELLRILNFHLDDKKFEQNDSELERKLKKEKKKNSINVYDLNNISKNIYYNKTVASESDYFIPLTLPFFTDAEKKEQKKIGKMFLDTEHFFFNVQLPNLLPSIADEEENEEPKELSSNKKKEDERNKQIPSTKYKLTNINSLPNGKFAKLIIYKNNKIKMKIGDILFDVNEGSTCAFFQEVACHIKDNSEFIFLGNCDKKIVVTPNIENMIQKTVK